MLDTPYSYRELLGQHPFFQAAAGVEQHAQAERAVFGHFDVGHVAHQDGGGADLLDGEACARSPYGEPSWTTASGRASGAVPSMPTGSSAYARQAARSRRPCGFPR